MRPPCRCPSLGHQFNMAANKVSTTECNEAATEINIPSLSSHL